MYPDDEQVFDFETAFRNLCLMTRDIVIVVVPFLQSTHGEHDDYWQFSPFAIKRMFEKNGMELLYLSFNNYRNASVYIFAIASKDPSKWAGKIHKEFSCMAGARQLDGFRPLTGMRAVLNYRYGLKRLVGSGVRRLFGLFGGGNRKPQA